jgi:hypothetical protein
MRKTDILASLHRRGFDESRVVPFTRSAVVCCSQCEALSINGVPCHETGCPNKPIECRYCGDTIPKGEFCSCYDVYEEGRNG